jgi:hypothetical protein
MHGDQSTLLTHIAAQLHGGSSPPRVRVRARPPSSRVSMLLALVFTLMARSSGCTADAAAAMPTIIVVGPNASLTEQYAAAELSQVLTKIACASKRQPCSSWLSVLVATSLPSSIPQIAVGWQASTALGLHPDKLSSLGPEGFVVSTQPADGVPVGSMALSGAHGAPRGTLYAVNSFLESIGVKFLAQDTTLLPQSLPKALPTLGTSYVPAMEYRALFEYTMRVRHVIFIWPPQDPSNFCPLELCVGFSRLWPATHAVAGLLEHLPRSSFAPWRVHGCASGASMDTSRSKHH